MKNFKHENTFQTPATSEEMRKTFESECICTKFGEHNPYCYHCNDILSIYEEFDVNPIASASLAQVYRAKINGEKVAIKALRPNVIDLINLDLMIIYDLRKFLIKILGFGTLPLNTSSSSRNIIKQLIFKNSSGI